MLMAKRASRPLMQSLASASLGQSRSRKALLVPSLFPSFSRRCKRFFSGNSGNVAATRVVNDHTTANNNTNNGWEVVIGLELHAQISSRSKLFSGAKNSFGEASNTNVSLVDAAYPGTLPVLNKHCVLQAIRAGLALSGRVNPVSRFDRKHYFYMDLPAGYQITQNQFPIVSGGHLTLFPCDESKRRVIRINRIQLEQDSGKSYHDQHPKYTYVDFNRAGIGLLEIISEPDIRSPQEAAEYLEKMGAVLQVIGVNDPRTMDASSLRCDVNVSLNRPGQPLGTRCEVKNVNSIKQITRAIEYEIQRQMQILENGGVVEQETRNFDPVLDQTVRLRTKEDEVDYRYFPEPDLPPLVVAQSLIDGVRAELPELPDAKTERLMAQYGLSLYDSKVLVETQGAAQFFEDAMTCRELKVKDEKERKKVTQMVTNWITSELFGLLAPQAKPITESSVSSQQIRSIVELIRENKISGAIGKQVIADMFNGDQRDAHDIVEAKGLILSDDTKLLEEICMQVVRDNPDDVARYQAGKKRLKQFFVGEIMKQTKGRAHPKAINELLDKYLSSPQQ